MPIIGHNQINDALLHVRNRITQLENEKERKEEQTFELERLYNGIQTLQDNLNFVLEFKKVPEKQSEVVISEQKQIPTPEKKDKWENLSKKGDKHGII